MSTRTHLIVLGLVFFWVSAAGAQAPRKRGELITLPQGIVARSSDVNLHGPIDWGKYPPTYYWGDKPLLDLKEKPVLFLTHHSTGYDASGVAQPGAKALMDAFFRREFPVLHLYSFRFVTEKTFPFLSFHSRMIGVESEGGESALRFTGSRNFYFTGGHFRMCLCETIRDTVRNVTDATMTEATHFFFVEDGIYDVGRTLGSYVTQFEESGKPLSQLVSERILVKRAGKEVICGQNWKRQPEVGIEDYRIDVIDHDGKPLPLSTGTKAHFVFHFIKSADAEVAVK